MRFLKFISIPVFLFSFEIEFNKKFYHELPHDTLSTFVTVTIEDDTERVVSDRLSIFNQKIKSLDKVEKKLGTFNIRPKYRHSSNTPKIIGYIGELKYKVNSRKAKYMDEFVSEITNLKKNRDTNVSVNNLSWSVREETYNVTLDLLRLEAINWAESYSKNLSNDINKKCEVKKIDINTANQFYGNNRVIAMQSESISNKELPVPEANQEKIVINPKYIMECK